MSWASVLTVWTETCQPASFARPMVSVRSAGCQWKIVPQPLSSVIFTPLDAEAVADRPRLAVAVPVAEVLATGCRRVQGEVRVDAEGQARRRQRGR